jgi:hypothetical protein
LNQVEQRIVSTRFSTIELSPLSEKLVFKPFAFKRQRVPLQHGADINGAVYGTFPTLTQLIPVYDEDIILSVGGAVQAEFIRPPIA